MSFFRSAIRFASILLPFVLSLAAPGNAQIMSVTDNTSTPIAGAGHDYIHLLSETVNPANGSLSLRIQLPVPKGRGINLPFAFTYDSNAVHHLEPGLYPNFGTVSWKANTGTFAQGGWGYSVPAAGDVYWQPTEGNYPNFYSCLVYSNYVFHDPNGGVHSLGLGTSSSPNGACVESPVRSGGDATFQASMSSNDDVGGGHVSIFDADGTVYQFPGVGSSLDGSVLTLPTYIEDRNGNKLVSTSNGFYDTRGGTLISWSGFGPSGQTNTISVGGLSYKVSWKTTTASFSTTSTPQAGSGQGDTCQAIPTANDTQTVVWQIILPNGGTYTFYYGTDNPNPAFQNRYGLLSEIDYPDGGWVRYTWKLSDTTNELADYPGLIVQAGTSCSTDPQAYCPAAVQDGCLYQYMTPVVASRNVGFGGSSTPSLVQTFTYSTAWGSSGTSWTSKTTYVTTMDEVRSLSALTVYNYTPVGLFPQPYSHTSIQAQVPVESSVKYYNWRNTTSPFRTENKTWYDQFNLGSDQTILDNGQTSKITYCYAGSNCQPQEFPQLLSQLIEKDEYDFGASAPTRKTLTTYQVFSGTPGIIFDRPCTLVTEDAGGHTIAETDYLYDGGSSVCGAVVTAGATTAVAGSLPANTHDETLFSAASTTPRGNATKVAQKCLQSCSNATTTYSYDETGQVLSKTDACGNAACADMSGGSHSTTYSYADDYDSNPSSQTNAYLTQITDALGHSAKFQYAYSDGQLIESQDQNDINASRRGTLYSYNDPLRRLTSTSYPDGGSITISYNDSPYDASYSSPTPSVTTTKAGGASPSITTVQAFDGMGHTVETEVTTDPSGTTYAITNYDGLGRKHQVFNPTRCNPPTANCGESTWGVTNYLYDALGRLCVTAPPTGTVQTACPAGGVSGDIATVYTGRAAAVFDEGNGTQSVTRVSQSDALGRLTSVCEVAAVPFVVPSGSSTSSLVGQNGSPAACGQDYTANDSGFLTSYTYDVLDDLLTVAQGSLNRSFTFDSLSRLLSATNPESGTLNYSYDANGNVSTRTDARGVTTTYTYDALNRNTQKSYSDTTPAATFVYDVANIDGFGPLSNPVGRLVKATVGVCNSTYNEYDAMGRTTTQLVYLPVTCAVGQPDYEIFYTYDLMGHMTQFANGLFNTFTYAYDGAGRQFRLADASNPTKPLLSGACSSGSNVGACFNPLGEITSDTLGDGETETWSYDTRGRVTSSSAVLSNTAIYSFSNTYTPDGDVLTSNDSVNGNWIYSYDQFNRLVGSTKNSSAVAYIYDRFGNRWQENPGGFTATFTGNNPSSPQNNNRIDGYTYDAAGNLLSDGFNTYTYDAENRMITFSNAAGSSGTYVYDAFGVRVQKTTPTSVNNECSGAPNNGGPVYYLHDLSGQISVYSANGNNQCKDEVFAGSRHLAEYSVTPYYFHNDWLGTQRVRSATGGIAETCQSGAFGENMQCTVSNNDSPLHFTGKERDSESGLDNFGARYNASSMGRFMSPDPVFISAVRLTDPQSLNLYAYVRNNPLSLVDPTGLDFYLACQTLDHSGCGQVQNGSDKIWVQGQTVNGQFQATDVDMNDPKDVSAGYHDQFGNQYTGTFDAQNGVSFTNTATGDTSGHSRFIDGSDETDVNGSGAVFSGIEGKFFSDCGGSCEGRASLYETTPGAFANAEAALHKQGGFMTAIDLLSGAHKPGSQWKDSSGYVHMLNPSGQMEMHFEGHPTGVDVTNFVLHMVDTIRDASSGRAATERNTPLP